MDGSVKILQFSTASSTTGVPRRSVFSALGPFPAWTFTSSVDLHETGPVGGTEMSRYTLTIDASRPSHPGPIHLDEVRVREGRLRARHRPMPLPPVLCRLPRADAVWSPAWGPTAVALSVLGLDTLHGRRRIADRGVAELVVAGTVMVPVDDTGSRVRLHVEAVLELSHRWVVGARWTADAAGPVNTVRAEGRMWPVRAWQRRSQ